MKLIEKLVGQIDAHKKTVERLELEQIGTRSAGASVEIQKVDLDEMRAERRQLMAQAMVSKKPPAISSLDAKIANAEAKLAATEEEVIAAAEMHTIIIEGIALAKADLLATEQKLSRAVAEEILAGHDEALEKYLAAVVALEAGVIGMVAAQRAWGCVSYIVCGNGFPGYGSQVLEDIRTKGVRVPWSSSRLADPSVAKEYFPNFRDFWFVPAWADARTPGLADVSLSEIIECLRQAGLDCPAVIPYTPAPAERMLMVRVVQGTVALPPIIQRDPTTHEVKTRQPVSASRGDDFEVKETDARHLRQLGMVMIHGEDELPEPATSPDEATRFEAQVPRRRFGPGVDLDIKSSYRDNSHQLDLSTYE